MQKTTKKQLQSIARIWVATMLSQSEPYVAFEDLTPEQCDVIREELDRLSILLLRKGEKIGSCDSSDIVSAVLSSKSITK